jgi:ATP-dependent DNA helicase RecG
MTRLSDPLRGVLGGRSATALEQAFGMRTVGDLLRHLPRRYARRGELTPLAGLADGELVTVAAQVAKATSRRMKGRSGSILEVEVSDGTGRLELTFFNQAWRAKSLVPGRVGLFAGKVGTYRGRRQLAHPDYVLFADAADVADTAGPGAAADPAGRDADPDAAEFLRDFVPVYPATAKVASWTVGRCARIALEGLVVDPAEDPVPPQVAAANGLPDLAAALRLVHLPEAQEDIEAGRARLRFEEAWVVQVVLAQRRHAAAGLGATPRPPVPDGLVAALDARLPYDLTAGQREVGRQIDEDLAAARPMQRLLQGEVGSGKTAVALRAMLRVVENGGQAALLAPTEVLAEQHLRSIRALLGPLGQAGELGGADRATRVDLLTGSLPAARRRRVLLDAASGATGILIGTHALLSDPVQFADLGMVVVDEQHRFGVEQRAALAAKTEGARPHVLVMTATPIPRTIAMTVFGDLAVSTLRELPAGRAPTATHVVPAADRPHFVARMWQRIAEEVAAGRQAYVVCPRISPADEETAEAAPTSVAELAPQLQAGPLSGVRVAVLHGQLDSEEKDGVMRRFADPRAPDGVDVLVATTVVEVGVDVPNATVMVVMDADRFGVSQLHQLRGRVGRGGQPGLCLLHTAAAAGTPARERLEQVAQTADGFALAELDLAVRREGDVLGATQSGRRSSLELLSVLQHEAIIVAARRSAEALIAADPELAEHPGVAAAVRAWTDGALLEYVDKG